MEQPDHGESVAGEDQPEGKRWPSKKTMVSILILLIAALAVVVTIHLAKAQLPQYRRWIGKKLNNLRIPIFLLIGVIKKGGDYDVVQKLGRFL